MPEYQIHPLALVFPPMDETAFVSLKEDIRANGLRDALTLHEGKVLDGRNRYRACSELAIEPSVTVLQDGLDPLAFVVSKNLKRRHLNESQRGMVAARIANLPRGGDRGNQHTGGKLSIDGLAESANATQPTTQQKAGEMLNVSSSQVNRSKKVLDQGTAELVQAVDSGQIKVGAAVKLADLPPDKQKEEVEQLVAKKTKAKTRRQAGSTAKQKAPQKNRKTLGTHRATEGEVDTLTQQVQALVDQWGSLGQMKKLVAQWEDQRRWKFCDTLESLARILRQYSMDLRNHIQLPS